MQKTALWLREPVAVNFATGSSAKPPGFLNMRPIAKIMLVMRLTFILLFTSFMAVSATGVSQTITFSGKSVPLPKVFSVIKTQTGFVVFGNSSLLKEAAPVSLDTRDMPLAEFLDLVLKQRALSYKISGKTIILSHQATPEIPAATPDPQQVVIVITGRIVSPDGTPMQGVSVRVKGAASGSVTDAKGTFTINAEPGQVLVFTHVGMESQESKVTKNSTTFTIVMKAAETAIKDVIITGYNNNIRKESFTGNAIKVTQEQLTKVGNRNVISILQVFDPSFRLEKNNLRGSDPNTMPEFYVRGRSGIGVKELDKSGTDLSQAALTNNPNLPIFIMDGYEVTAQKVYDYDINMIKSITILKDAAATAVYGSRAANGVIVIETLPPMPGKLRVNYTGSATVTAPDLSDYNLMNAAEKLEAERLSGAYNIAGLLPTNAAYLTDEYIKKTAQVAKGVNTDWISQPLTNEVNQKHSVYIDGGSQQIRFGVSLKYDNQNGVMKKSGRNREGAGLTLDYRGKKIQVRNDVSYDVVKAQNSPYGNFVDYTWKSPYDRIYDDNGQVLKNTNNWHGGVTSELNLVNPLYEALKTKNYSRTGTNTLANNLAVNWNVASHLQFRGQVSVTKTDNTSESYIDPASGRYDIRAGADYSLIGQLNQGNSNMLSINTNAFANYVNTIQDHNINVSAGINTLQTEGSSSTAVYTGFSSGDQHTPNLAAKISGKPSYAQNQTRMFGSFLTLNYSFKDIYLLDISSRLDGSSEFGNERKFAPFWSIGTGVNLHKYEFLRGSNVISRARITANMGQLGKTNFPPYAAKDNYNLSSNWYSTGPGVSLYAMGNTGLTWEKTNTYDLIFDLGLLKDRISVNVNLYRKLTRDLVNDVNLPLSSGFTQYKDNIGEVENKGFEIQFRADVIKKKDLLIAVYGNFAANRNRLVNISNALKEYNQRVDDEYKNYTTASSDKGPANKIKFSTPHIKYVEGGSLTSVFGMRSLGINPMDGREVFMRKDGTITYDWNAFDQVIIGDMSPKGQGAFGINGNYKGITLFASFLYEFGGDEYNNTLLSKVENVDIYNRNADRRLLTDRWKQPGDLMQFKNIADRSQTTRPTSRFMQRYNAVSFNSLSLGYAFNQATLRKLGGLNMLRFQFTTNNLAKITTVKQERGLDYPFARTFDFSINLGF
ncbi:SusC/RagA family TonB-linked outer membrane protein [Chitinophaga arvensicola]|uniref:TonB-linked outer membrane protein, SusC/RagA family n=1 Tax=Chitinophaga arvensicola TaxID=29529 RepID=A0A1I0NM63_9BACT|nr:SusC/RagA family TonB-linked outer membrane protein [Chitinophaga arvensicola]SEW01965.1 TonB-linked outer membrane protein, SusC/RagA family [Chitinophaga arvensicola]